MRTMTNILVTAAALAAASVCPAQSVPKPLWVNIPFAFSAHHTKMPAGRYTLAYDATRDVWKLRTFGHADVEFHGTWQKLQRTAASDAVLFARTGDTFRLLAIREDGMGKVAQFNVAEGKPQQEVASANTGMDLLRLLRLRHPAEERQ